MQCSRKDEKCKAKKNPAPFDAELMGSGGDLCSRAVSSQVLSALKGLTSVFGMGTGGTPSSLPPEMVIVVVAIRMRFAALPTFLFLSLFRSVLDFSERFPQLLSSFRLTSLRRRLRTLTTAQGKIHYLTLLLCLFVDLI